MNRLLRRISTGAACAAIALATASVSADVAPADRAAARALFDQARTLAKEGKYAEACPKFEESQRLDPGMGTLFNLADCHEHAGRTATAWTLFLEVASQAKSAGQPDREKAARQRASSLEATLSRLTVAVPSASEIPGLEVRRDGSLVGKPLWGAPVPVDPGPHTLEATAPGRKKWTQTVQVGSAGATATATIPELEADTAAAPPIPPSTAPTAVSSAPIPVPGATPTASPSAGVAISPAPDSSSVGGTQRTLGWISGGVGLLGLGASAILTLGAKSKVSDAAEYCVGAACNDPKGVELHDDARKQAELATIMGGGGAAFLVGGAVLLLTAPSAEPPKESKTSRAPVLVVGPGSWAVKGVW